LVVVLTASECHSIWYWTPELWEYLSPHHCVPKDLLNCQSGPPPFNVRMSPLTVTKFAR
jgi:hypothetical protein